MHPRYRLYPPTLLLNNSKYFPRPVCTTELAEVARRKPDFEARGVKVIGISANGLEDHKAWVYHIFSIYYRSMMLISSINIFIITKVKDIEEWGGKVGPTEVTFPIVCLKPIHKIRILTLITLFHR